MTAITITSRFTTATRERNTYYTVVVNDFDGDSKEYEISAQSEQEASRKAENIAQNEGIQVSYIEVYK